MADQARQAERRKFWTELVARHKQSGKTVEAFCQENGVGGPSFYAWRKRLAEKGQPIELEGHLLKVRGLARELDIEIRLHRGGRRVRLRQLCAHGHQREFGSACHLQHVQVAVAVTGVEGLDLDRDQEIAHARMAGPFAARLLADAVGLVQGMADVIA